MSGERVNVLKRRAIEFLKLAEELTSRAVLDLAAFCVHPACQLRVKAILLRLTGIIPKTHGIRELLGMLASNLDEVDFKELAQHIRDFIKRNRDVLIDIDSSYIESRYGLVAPSQNTVQEMIKVAKALFELLDKIERHVLG